MFVPQVSVVLSSWFGAEAHAKCESDFSEPQAGELNTLLYKRSRFVTHLPLKYLYSPSHYWLIEQKNTWRIGLTRFAARMIGEIVDFGFEAQAASDVHPGQTIGWIEGFKAISDLVCVVDGKFLRSNPELSKNPEAIDRDCYGQGWLYEANGKPDSLCVDVQGYKDLLDGTIDKLSEKHDAPD